MIQRFGQQLQQDIKFLVNWMKGHSMQDIEQSDLQYRIQVATVHIFAALSIVFTALSGLSFISFIIIFPLKVAFKLVSAGLIYAIAYDIFRIHQNSNKIQIQESVISCFFDGSYQQLNLIDQLTQDTILKPAWMKLYLLQSKLNRETFNHIQPVIIQLPYAPIQRMKNSSLLEITND